MTRRQLTEDEIVDWLVACQNDPSILAPWELGYRPDGTHRTDDLTEATK